MTGINEGVKKPIADLPSAAAAAAANLIRASQSGSEVQMTLTQLLTLIKSDLGTMTADDITVSSMTISGLTGALSAFTFTTTGQTSAAIGAVTSADATNAWCFASKGQIEAVIEAIKNNKTAIDELRS